MNPQKRRNNRRRNRRRRKGQNAKLPMIIGLCAAGAAVLGGGITGAVLLGRSFLKQDTGELYFHITDEAHIAADDAGILYADNEILLVAEDGVKPKKIETLAHSCGAEIVGMIEMTGDYQLLLPEPMTMDELEAMAEQLEAEDIVADASVNYVSEMTLQGSSVQYGSEWDDIEWSAKTPGGKNWGLEAIDAMGAWEYMDRMTPVRIGLIDAGFDADSSVEQCVTPQPNDGHEDLGFAATFYNDKPSDHGTIVAGVMAATADNELGICGVYPFGEGNLYGVSRIGIENIQYVTGMSEKCSLAELILRNVKVINCSYGYDQTVLLAEIDNNKEIIQDCFEKSGIVGDFLARLLEKGYDFIIVQASGNHSNTYYTHLTPQNAAYPYIDDSGVVYYDETGFLYEIVKEVEYSSFLGFKEENVSYLYYDSNDVPHKIVSSSKMKIIDAKELDSMYASMLSCISKEKYPDVFDRIVVVGAIGNHDTIADENGKTIFTTGSIYSKSNLGKRTDILAPGEDIFSTYYSDGSETEYKGEWNGTSVAAPHVAGVAAMVWAVDNSLTGAEVKEILCKTGEPLYSKDQKTTYPLVNAKNAVEVALNLKSLDDFSDIVDNAMRGTEPDAEPAFRELLKGELLTKYGLSSMAVQSSFITVQTQQNAPAWVNPEGMLAAQIADLDGDGTEEMLLLRAEETSTMPLYQVYADVYVMENGRPVCSQSTPIRYYNEDARTDTMMEIEGKKVLNETFRVSVKDNLLLFELQESAVFGDGYSVNLWMMEYADDTLRPRAAFLQTAGGSSGFAHTGYLYENGALISKEVLYNDGSEGIPSPYPDFDTAVQAFFSQFGLTNPGVMEDEAFFTDEPGCSPLFTYEISAAYRGQTYTEADFTYQPVDHSFLHAMFNGAILGYVTDDSGTPIPGASVRAVDENGASYEASTDAEGHFEHILPPGTYTLEVSAEGYEKQTLKENYIVQAEETVNLKQGITMQYDEITRILNAYLDNESVWLPDTSLHYDMSLTEFWFQDLNGDGICEMLSGGPADTDVYHTNVNFVTSYANGKVKKSPYIEIKGTIDEPLEFKMCKNGNNETVYLCERRVKQTNGGWTWIIDLNAYGLDADTGLFKLTEGKTIRAWDTDNGVWGDDGSGFREMYIGPYEYIMKEYNAMIFGLNEVSYTVDKIGYNEYVGLSREEKLARLRKSYEGYTVGETKQGVSGLKMKEWIDAYLNSSGMDISIQPATEAPKAENGWKAAYLEYLSDLDYNRRDGEFALVNLNNDGIPDIYCHFVVTGLYGGGKNVWCYKDGEVEDVKLMYDATNGKYLWNGAEVNNPFTAAEFYTLSEIRSIIENY